MAESHMTSAIEGAMEGNAVLFVGSGFSRSARNLKNESLKTAPELAKHLSNECGLQDVASLEDAAGLFVSKHTPAELIAYWRPSFR